MVVCFDPLAMLKPACCCRRCRWLPRRGRCSRPARRTPRMPSRWGAASACGASDAAVPVVLPPRSSRRPRFSPPALIAVLFLSLDPPAPCPTPPPWPACGWCSSTTTPATPSTSAPSPSPPSTAETRWARAASAVPGSPHWLLARAWLLACPACALWLILDVVPSWTLPLPACSTWRTPTPRPASSPSVRGRSARWESCRGWDWRPRAWWSPPRSCGERLAQALAPCPLGPGWSVARRSTNIASFLDLLCHFFCMGAVVSGNPPCDPGFPPQRPPASPASSHQLAVFFFFALLWVFFSLPLPWPRKSGQWQKAWGSVASASGARPLRAEPPE